MTIADAHRSRLGGSIVATAMRLTAPRRFEPMEAPLSGPAEGEVLVRIAGCGVCASNVPPWEGREWFTYPMAPGAPVCIVVNDRRDLYPEILRRSGLRLDDRLERHVNRRTGRRAGEYFESILVCSAS